MLIIHVNYLPIFSTSHDNFHMPDILEKNKLGAKHPFAFSPKNSWMSVGLLFTFRRKENQLYSHVDSKPSF